MAASTSRWPSGRSAIEPIDAPASEGEGGAGARSWSRSPAGTGQTVRLVGRSALVTHPAVPGRAGTGSGRVPVPARCRQSFRHEAFLWHDAVEFTDHLVPFLREGYAAEEPVLVLVTSEHARWLLDVLGTDPRRVDFIDVTELGRNPARILSVIQDYTAARGGRPARVVVEPVWPARRPDELVECRLCDALLNVVVAPDCPLWLTCAYHQASLGPAALEAVHRSHPAIAGRDSYQGSLSYGGYPYAAALAGTALPELEHDTQLRLAPCDVPAAVQAVTLAGVGAGLSSDQILRLNQATRKLMAASARRGAATMMIQTADTTTALIVDVVDNTKVDDLVLGRCGTAEADTQECLRLVNTICDLVQTRFSPGGTTIRIHTWKAMR